MTTALPLPRVVNPWELSGINPASAGQAKVRQALQDALDSFDADRAPNADNRGGVVRLPGVDADYAINWPLQVNRHNMSIEGDGPGISRIVGTTGHDVLACGFAPLPVDPGHWTPNWLPGQSARWSFATLGKAQLYGQGCAFDRGPIGGWGSLSGLTIAGAFDLSGIRPDAPAVSLCGMRTGTRGAAPAHIWIGNGNLILSILGADGHERTYSSMNVPLRKVEIVVQFDGAPFFAFDGKVVAPHQWEGPPWTPGLRLGNPDPCPWKFGGGGLIATGTTEGGGYPLGLAGCHWQAGAAYKPGAVGSPLARIDGKAITPEATYFTPTQATIGLLPLTAPPEGRVIEATGWLDGWPRATTMYQVDQAHIGAYMGGVGLRGVGLMQGGPSRWGRGLAVGQLMGNGLAVDRCRIVGNASGVGPIALGSAYPVLFERSLIGCGGDGDSAVHLIGASSTFRDCRLDSGRYRAGFRAWGGNLAIDNLFTPHGGSPEYGIQAKVATLAVRGFGADQEGASGVGTTIALVYCSPSDDPAPGSCRIDGLGESVCGPDSVMVLLDEGYGQASVADLRGLGNMIGMKRRAERDIAKNWSVTPSSDPVGPLGAVGPGATATAKIGGGI